jgi:hypothetical protein
MFPSPVSGSAAIRHPGQIPRSGMRAGIQNDLIFRHVTGFPFDFAQGGEPAEPRVSPSIVWLARNDSSDELRYSLSWRRRCLGKFRMPAFQRGQFCFRGRSHVGGLIKLRHG